MIACAQEASAFMLEIKCTIHKIIINQPMILCFISKYENVESHSSNDNARHL